MLYLYCALGLLMSAGSILHGASCSSDTNPEGRMRKRMIAQGAARIFHTDSADPVKQLIAASSRRHCAQFCPERSLEAQRRFNNQLTQRTIPRIPISVPVSDSSSELQQCFKHARVWTPSLPTGKPTSYTTIMMLSPQPDGNKLEMVMFGSPNQPLLEYVTIKTVLSALRMLAGDRKAPLIYTLHAEVHKICNKFSEREGNIGGRKPYFTTSHNVHDIQGSAFEFTSEAAPAEPVLMAQSLLPAYFEYEHGGDMAKYLGALSMFGAHIAPSTTHHMAQVLIPDTARLQAYLARKDVQPAVIVNHKELRNPSTILSVTKPSTVPHVGPGEWRRGMVRTASGVFVPQEVMLQRFIDSLPDGCFTKE